jgi:hypothetical protein
MPQRRHLLRALEILAALVGIFLLYRVFRQHDFGEIGRALARIPAGDIAVAAAFTAGSYVCLTIGEYMGVVYASSRRVPLSRIILTTVASLGIGHSVGLSALSSGAIRYRMYSRAGLDAGAVAKVMLFSGATVGLGLLTLFCLTLLLQSDMIAGLVQISAGHLHRVAFALAAIGLLYLFACWRQPPALRLGPAKVAMPSALMTAGQMIAGTLNFLCIAGALHACLSSLTDVAYTEVVTLVIVSDTAAIIGHVPGGWGVLEYIVSSALTGTGIIAGILAFRAVYYLAPLAIGVGVLIADEIASRKRQPRIQQPAIQGS